MGFCVFFFPRYSCDLSDMESKVHSLREGHFLTLSRVKRQDVDRLNLAEFLSKELFGVSQHPGSVEVQRMPPSNGGQQCS